MMPKKDDGCISREEFRAYVEESHRYREANNQEFKDIKAQLGGVELTVAGIKTSVDNFLKIFEIINEEVNGKDGLNRRFIAKSTEGFSRIEILEEKQKTSWGMIWVIITTIIILALGIVLKPSSLSSRMESKQSSSSNLYLC